MIKSTGYSLGRIPREAESKRLGHLQKLLDPKTLELIDQLGVGQGDRVLEVGAGRGSVAGALADRVGDGEVHVLDPDLGHLDAKVAERSVIRMHEGLVETDPLLDDTRFDFVHARYVLAHLPHRDAVITRLVGTLGPGGTILLEEPGPVIQSPAPGHDTERLAPAVRAAMLELEKRNGNDFSYGMEIPAALEANGIERVEAEAHSTMVRGGGHVSGYITPYLEEIRDDLVHTGYVSQADLETWLSALDDPSRLSFFRVTISAWGRRR